MHPVKAVSNAMASPILMRLARTIRVFRRGKKLKARIVTGRALVPMRTGFRARRASQSGNAATVRLPNVKPPFCLIFMFDKIRAETFPWLWGEHLIQMQAVRVWT
jgi:hypothetical protein